MSVGEERENMMQLPLAERMVAVALKHVFDEIKKIDEEQAKEINAIHLSFIDKFKVVEEKASSIIKGAPISLEDLKDKEKYFNTTENGAVEELAKNNKGIQAYWLTVFRNFFQEDLTSADKEIAVGITDISTCVTEDKLELIFQIASNQWLQPGKFSRRFFLEDGIPIKAEGDLVKWLKAKPEGLLPKILDGAHSQEELNSLFPLIGEIINDMVPYSLQFYLGIVEEQDLIDVEENQGEEQEECSDDDLNEGPQKKVKQ